MIARILRNLGDRYPNATEKAAILEYLKSVSARKAALEELREQIPAIIADIIAEQKKIYPQFEKIRYAAWEKAGRDLGFLLAFQGNFAFVGETETLDEIMLEWYRTILQSAHVTPQYLRDAFNSWDRFVKVRVSPEAYEYLRPLQQHMTKKLTNIPEPIRAEVGERVYKSSRM